EGRRKFETLATFEKAKIRADAINDSVNSGRLELLSLSSSQCEEYGQAAELGVSSGLTLPSVALQFMDARKILGGVSIVEAAQFYKKHHQDVIAKTIPQIREEFLAAKLAHGISRRYARNLTNLLKQFEKTFTCDLASVAGVDIAKFLSGSVECSRWRKV